jgi:hypothetical protein
MDALPVRPCRPKSGNLLSSALISS